MNPRITIVLVAAQLAWRTVAQPTDANIRVGSTVSVVLNNGSNVFGKIYRLDSSLVWIVNGDQGWKIPLNQLSWDDQKRFGYDSNAVARAEAAAAQARLRASKAAAFDLLIKTEYDRFEDSTSYSSRSPIHVGTGIEASFLCWTTGHSNKPALVMLHLASTSSDWKFLDYRNLVVLCDTNKMDFGKLKHDGRVGRSYVLEQMFAILSLGQLKALAFAKSVEAKLGSHEIDFSYGDRVSMRTLISYLEEHGTTIVADTSSVNPSSSPGSIAKFFKATVTGTGFFISEDGYLVSNAHVVEGAAAVRLVTNMGTNSAKVVKVDAANDLALLKAEGKFAALPVAASRAMKLGGTVATVGFPNIGLQGFAPKLAKGEIASLSGTGDDARYFQISVPVQPGNSGGALVDERGNVVGVVSAKLNPVAALATSGAFPENVNYAVKSSFLLSFLESVPEVSAKLKQPNTKDQKFEDVVKSAEQAAVLVLVY
jgi:S1-C subfamily serine protease